MDYNLGEKEVSEMEQILKKMGWASIVTSIAFAIIGLIMVYNPDTTFKVISYLIGGFFIIFGIIKIFIGLIRQLRIRIFIQPTRNFIR